jgi:hypothetical protein
MVGEDPQHKELHAPLPVCFQCSKLLTAWLDYYHALWHIAHGDWTNVSAIHTQLEERVESLRRLF